MQHDEAVRPCSRGGPLVVMQGRHRSRLALGIAAGSQALISFMVAIAPVIAPAMAPQLGLNPDRVGLFNALCYFAAMVVGGVVAPWIAWWGPVRMTQYMLVLAAIGGALAALGIPPLLVVAALVLGSSMGFPNPALSVILGRYAPVDSLGLYLSLRQAAAPIGVAVASLAVPLAGEFLGWRGTLLAAVAVCLAGAVMVGRTVRRLDWRVKRKPRLGESVRAFRGVLEHPAIRRLAVVSLAFCMVQQGFLGYAVLLLVNHGVSLKSAAGLLAFSQGASVLSRVFMGRATDRGLSPRPLLAANGVAMAMTCAALAWLPTSPSIVLAGVIMALSGITTMSWLSLLYAQLMRIIPLEDLGHCASGIQVFTFSGAMLGPFLMAMLLEHGGSYTAAFLLLGGLAALAGVSLLGHAPSIKAERDRSAALGR